MTGSAENLPNHQSLFARLKLTNMLMQVVHIVIQRQNIQQQVCRTLRQSSFPDYWAHLVSESEVILWQPANRSHNHLYDQQQNIQALVCFGTRHYSLSRRWPG